MLLETGDGGLAMPIRLVKIDAGGHSKESDNEDRAGPSTGSARFGNEGLIEAGGRAAVGALNLAHKAHRDVFLIKFEEARVAAQEWHEVELIGDFE